MTDQEFRKKIAAIQKQFAKNSATLLNEYLKEVSALHRQTEQTRTQRIRSRIK